MWSATHEVKGAILRSADFAEKNQTGRRRRRIIVQLQGTITKARSSMQALVLTVFIQTSVCVARAVAKQRLTVCVSLLW